MTYVRTVDVSMGRGAIETALYGNSSFLNSSPVPLMASQKRCQKQGGFSGQSRIRLTSWNGGQPGATATCSLMQGGDESSAWLHLPRGVISLDVPSGQ